MQRVSDANLVGLERDAGVRFRMGAPEAHQMTDPPGHDQIQRNGTLQFRVGVELQRFNAATVFQGVEEKFHFPPCPVPLS